ncbi:MAG: bifunctional phosphopantothenoylcysteine decarboxylase/phosphopantothenate--cysteine ligase CoaBC [Zoogloeaceae bacterium]|jgi:phosphopantothenoylcysteine decarboxylase/phosphopantothenate--cysteine ligase|nr:bifunctional phosphopantothenoylcysteine decarboxylase/phosphopantothenate--cysteine ligase CoaBC [Zoogloeaceae bacterium]
MLFLKDKTILLGVCGGVAAYKAALLLRLLRGAGADVRVALTDAAARFVTPATFQALSGRPVFTKLWDERVDNHMPHIALSRAADLMLVAPATADFLARAASGRADDLLSALALARNCPLFVAPAMNRQMWEHPATQRNAAQLKEDGVGFFGPESGEQACGEEGEGRMLEPERILSALENALTPKTLSGKKVLLTAGPTFEAIDPVRGLTNLSSGKMGYAIARAARMAGAEVALISGPVALAAPPGVLLERVTSALEMRAAVMRHLEEKRAARKTDVFIAVAAVADYRVERVGAQKHKKEHGAPPEIRLLPNPDILAEVALLPDAPFCVGFAAESEQMERYAEEKRRRKKIPLMAGNLIQDGFGGDGNRITLFDDTGAHPLEPGSKDRLARQLIARLSLLLESQNHA